MHFSLDTNSAKYQIQSYQAGCITINEQQFKHSIAVLPHHLISPWHYHSSQEFTLDDFQQILTHKPSIILLGTGVNLLFPKTNLQHIFYPMNIGIEIMDTGAACRTYSILSAEGRNVAAALII